MKKTISVKWVIICLCLISVFTALFVVSRLVVDAKNQKDTLIQRDGPTLKVGRYYIDGDTEQYYLEVTKEGTIQLCNIDYYEYSMLGNKDILSYSKEIQDGIKEEAKRYAENLSRAHKYKVVETTDGKDYRNVFIFTDWHERPSTINKDRTLYTGFGYSYIDENTIKSGNQIFIYYDEELGDTVYKTETPTRVVYSVSYKEKKNNIAPMLKVGRYYIDGDTEQYYLEVTEEGTIQLCDIDYLEYAWIGNSTDGLPKAEADKVTENVRKQADEYSKKYEYKVYKTGVGTMIFTEWEEVDGQCFGSGYTFLDENTIRGGNSIFIYYDEELGDTVYKTETPTRVVYSVSYKEKNKMI